MKRKSAARHIGRSPKRRRSMSLPLSPPSTDSARETGPHAVDEEPSVDCTPISRPEITVDTYDADFGAKVCAAWDVKQEITARAHAWRRRKYGSEVAVRYSAGSTPENLKEEYKKAQEEELRKWWEEMTSDEEDEEDEDQPAQHCGQHVQQEAPAHRKRRHSIGGLHCPARIRADCGLYSTSSDTVYGHTARGRMRSAPPESLHPRLIIAQQWTRA